MVVGMVVCSETRETPIVLADERLSETASVVCLLDMLDFFFNLLKLSSQSLFSFLNFKLVYFYVQF